MASAYGSAGRTVPLIKKSRPNNMLLDYLNNYDECTSYWDFADSPDTSCNSAGQLSIFKTAALSLPGGCRLNHSSLVMSLPPLLLSPPSGKCV